MSTGDTEKRQLAREPSQFDVTCSSNGARSPARLRDVTAHGCSVRTDAAILASGNRVRMQIAQMSTIDGEIVWHDGLDAGIAFAAPLHRAVVEFIADKLEAQAEAEIEMVQRDRFGRALPALEDLVRGFGRRAS